MTEPSATDAEHSGRRNRRSGVDSASQNGEGGAVTRIVLIRHGESQAHLDGIVAGHDNCSGLSDLGRRQAEALRRRLAATREVQADVLLTSILPRAVETAEIVGPALGADLKPEQRCELCELHAGESDGLTWEEYRARYPIDPQQAPTTPIAPGAESIASFQERVHRALAAVVEEHEGRTVAVVCHGGVIISSFSFFLGLAPEQLGLQRIWVDNTAVTEWSRHNGTWRLMRNNDAAHLHDLEPA